MSAGRIGAGDEPRLVVVQLVDRQLLRGGLHQDAVDEEEELVEPQLEAPQLLAVLAHAEGEGDDVPV